jgi:hypothetical protein
LTNDSGAEPKEEFPEKKMGFDPQKRFAKSDKTSNVENRVWCELVKLHTVHEKKPMKELVGRERKTAQEKSKKHHPKAALGLGDPLGARKDDLIIIGDEAISLGLVQIFLLENRRHPAGRGVSSVALAHLVLLRKMLNAHLQFAHGGCAGARRCARFATMVAAAEARNW